MRPNFSISNEQFMTSYMAMLKVFTSLLSYSSKRGLCVKNTSSDFALCVYVCNPILVTTFREWLSGTEPLPHTHLAPCVNPRCVCSVLRAHVQFCRFDKADATADVQ